jgi:hypothetical protein
MLRAYGSVICRIYIALLDSVVTAINGLTLIETAACSSRSAAFRAMKGSTHAIHVDAVRVAPGVLVALDQPVRHELRDVVEVDELLDAGLHLVVLFGALVYP